MSDMKQTDLSKRLRGYAQKQPTVIVSADFATQCADEIDRYYTGMLNWKATAEAQSTQPEATKPAQDLGDRNTQGPLLIARIKRYKEAFGCLTAEAKEACEYGRDLNSDQTAFVSPPKKDSTLARQIIRDTNDTLREQYEALVQLKAENDQLRAALASPADALVAGDRVDAITDAARSVLREALDAAEVHPCDTNNDSARAKQLSPLMQNLYRAIQAQKDGHG